MSIESFVETFAVALGLEDHVSRMSERGPEDCVVAALLSPSCLTVEEDTYCRTQSSEEDCNDSN